MRELRSRSYESFSRDHTASVNDVTRIWTLAIWTQNLASSPWSLVPSVLEVSRWELLAAAGQKPFSGSPSYHQLLERYIRLYYCLVFSSSDILRTEPPRIKKQPKKRHWATKWWGMLQQKAKWWYVVKFWILKCLSKYSEKNSVLLRKF